MPEIQIKVGTVADMAGLNQADAGVRKLSGNLSGLQEELKKKLSMKGIGTSVLEGLGIGSGFRIADTISDMIVKPFREAADYAKMVEENTANALKRFQEFRDLKNADNVGAQQKVLEDEKRRAQNAMEAAKNSREGGLGATYVKEVDDGKGGVKWETGYNATEEEMKLVEETAKAYDIAARALDTFNLKLEQKEKAGEKKDDSGLIDAEMKRQADIAKGDKEAAKAKAEWIQKNKDLAKSIIEASEPASKLANSIKEIEEQEVLGTMTAEQARLAIAKLNAEFNRPEMIRKSAQALELYREQLNAIDNNPLLTDKEKREARAVALAAENVEIRKQIALWTALNAVAPDAATQDRIDQLNKDKRVNEASAIAPASKMQGTAKAYRSMGDPENSYQGMSEGAIGGMMEALVEFGTLADNVAASFKSVMSSAVNSISNGITGLIMQTTTWRNALANIGTSILTSIVSAIVQMGVRWVATQLIMAAFGKAITAASIATSIPMAMAASAVWAAPATLATIATMGGAALQAPITIASAQGMVLASSLLAMEKGGMIPGGEQFIRVNEAGQEAVLNAGAVSQLGAEFVNAANAGNWAQAAQYLNPITALTRPGFSPEMQAGGAGAIERDERESKSIAVSGFNAQYEIAQWFDGRTGRKWAVDLVRSEVRKIS